MPWPPIIGLGWRSPVAVFVSVPRATAAPISNRQQPVLASATASIPRHWSTTRRLEFGASCIRTIGICDRAPRRYLYACRLGLVLRCSHANDCALDYGGHSDIARREVSCQARSSHTQPFGYFDGPQANPARSGPGKRSSLASPGDLQPRQLMSRFVYSHPPIKAHNLECRCNARVQTNHQRTPAPRFNATGPRY